MSKQTILDTAFELFSRDGYTETTLKAIAVAVGIKAPSIYAHFPNKEELYLDVYRQSQIEYGEFFEQFAHAAADQSPAQRLHQILFGIGEFYLGRPALFAFHLRHLVATPAEIQSVVSGVFITAEERLRDLILDAYTAGCTDGSFTPGNPDDFCNFFLCLMDGVFLQMRHYDPETFRDRLNSVWAQVLAFLQPVPAS
ncbi:TetR/AcrR family transcriptional regulator [Paeniglutamicibacter sp. R2-26]|uniref:TetR/AcrR family transcriptional regulator n=1 Tax=Paeniglutamicibacter sp. R2-26 TaxID=3144417 RepID=UPI003EE63B10